jgi:hypothetical protein
VLKKISDDTPNSEDLMDVDVDDDNTRAEDMTTNHSLLLDNTATVVVDVTKRDVIEEPWRVSSITTTGELINFFTAMLDRSQQYMERLHRMLTMDTLTRHGPTVPKQPFETTLESLASACFSESRRLIEISGMFDLFLSTLQAFRPCVSFDPKMHCLQLADRLTQNKNFGIISAFSGPKTRIHDWTRRISAVTDVILYVYAFLMIHVISQPVVPGADHLHMAQVAFDHEWHASVQKLRDAAIRVLDFKHDMLLQVANSA